MRWCPPMMDPQVLRQLVEELIPFNRFLGVRVRHQEKGRIEVEIPWRDELMGDPFKRAVHGGVIGALVDTAGGMVLWAGLQDPAHQRLSTIDLRIDYLRPGRPEDLVAEAVVVRAGRTVGVADMRVFHPTARDETIATGKGVYVIKTPRSKS